MSGIEVAGLVIGAIPLVISALENYQAGKGVAATMFKFRGLLDKLIRQLRSQRVFFYTKILVLLREARVAEAGDMIDPTQEECIRILQNVQARKEIKEYLGQVYEPFIQILGQYEKCLKTLAGALGHLLRPRSADKDDLSAIIMANREPNNKITLTFKGRLKFTIKYKSLLGILDDLRREREALDTLIEDTKMLREVENKDSSQTSRRLSQLFSDVQGRAEALFGAVCQSCVSCQCRPQHTLMMRLGNRIPDRDGQQHLYARRKWGRDDILFDLYVPIDADHFQEMVVRVAPVRADSEAEDDDNHGKGTVNFAPAITATPVTTASNSLLESREITKICQHAKEASRRGEILAFRLAANGLEPVRSPSSTANKRKSLRDIKGAITLADFLRDTTDDEDAKLTPKQRTLLALDVASSVLQLRQTLWCSAPDAWTKTSVKFLVQGAQSSVLCIPFMEQHIYQDLVSNATQLQHGMEEALLNLAILLLEIWHHTSFEACTAAAVSAAINAAKPIAQGALHPPPTGLPMSATTPMPSSEPPPTPVTVQPTLSLGDRALAASAWLKRTSTRLPLHHLEAVEECLRFYFGRQWAWDDAQFQQMYCENIIRPLQESCKAWEG